MSDLPPLSLTAVRARISEETPRDLRGVDLLAADLASRLGQEPAAIEGRRAPFGRTPWREDLPASEAVLRVAGARAADAVRAGAVPVTLASDCSLAIGTLPAVAREVAGLRVLWLDAHADYDTPETETVDFLGCMSLGGACGAWETGHGTIDPQQVVHVGARAPEGDFDYAGQEQGRAELGAMLPARAPVAEVLAALGDGPLYVHLDPDVLDPSVNPIDYGRPGGLGAEELLALLRAVRAHAPVVGFELTAFHSADDEPTRARVCALLGDAIETLAGRSPN